MASALNQFNLISSVYDALVRIIYGKKLITAQTYFLPVIPDDATVLIIGGGSGKLLQELFKRKPDCKVIYVEASSSMIALAKKHNHQNLSRIEFVHGTEDSIRASMTVDTIITPFFLDLFSEPSLSLVLKKLNTALRPDGKWIVTDFVASKKISHRFLLWLMYRFFRIVSGIKTSDLPDWNSEILKMTNEISSKEFVEGFVKTALFEKSTNR
jgi:tRNA (cmo5U34)-methyltransferase